MPLYWLCYHHNNQISVVIEPAASIIHARIAGLEGKFTEGPLEGTKADEVPSAQENGPILKLEDEA